MSAVLVAFGAVGVSMVSTVIALNAVQTKKRKDRSGAHASDHSVSVDTPDWASDGGNGDGGGGGD
jgi:hypothetical protein